MNPRVEQEAVHYVLNMRAGSSDKTFQEGLKRDCGPDGTLLPERMDASGQGLLFADFCQHPHSVQAGLLAIHVLGLRLYTTILYQTINAPLRDFRARSQVTSYRLQVTSYRLQVTCYKLQVTSYKRLSRSLAAHRRSQTARDRQRHQRGHTAA